MDSVTPDATVSGDEDDDWPTRYSWLDDETDESGRDGASAEADAGDEANETAAADGAVAPAARASDASAAAEPSRAAGAPRCPPPS